MQKDYNYNIEECKKESVNAYAMMNSEQKNIFDHIIEACYSNNNNHQKLFFVDAPGGTGKTFSANDILLYIRARHDIAIATASSGIAAILLKG